MTQEIPRLRAKDYMDEFINPPDYMDEQRKKMERERDKPKKFPAEPERDVLLFLLQHAPLEPWERDILEIVRDEAYYFAPQRQTKILNEGWAAYWHSKIMTQKALKASRDHRLRRPQRRRAGDGARAVQPVQDRHRAAARHRGALGQGPLRQGVERVRRPGRARRTWDKRLGLGRKKIFEVRKLYNDVTFIDEFFTEDFCREQPVLLVLAERAQRQLRDRLARVPQDQAEDALPADQLRRARSSWSRTPTTTTAASCSCATATRAPTCTIDHARATLTALERIWRRPVNLLTVVEGKQKLLRYDGKEQVERSLGN